MAALTGTAVASPPRAIELGVARSAGSRLDVVTVLREHGPYVHKLLRGLGVHNADLDDAFQEVFVVIHRKLDSYNDQGSLRAWVYGICARVALRARTDPRVRREVPTDELPEVVDPRNPAEHVNQQQARRILYAILDELDHDKRAVFVLYELEELSMIEVAQSLDCPLQTAYSRLRAARQAFEDAVRRHRMRRDFR